MIRVGVIGTGFIGKAHIEQIRRLGCAEVIALADIYGAAKTAAQLHVPKSYSDYKEMILCEKPDIVHICTPNHMHYEISMFAMEQGCNVVCEKPICLNVWEAEEMACMAEKKDLVNGMNLHNRFFPMVQELRQRIADGRLGSIHALNGWYLQDWLLFDSDFNWRIMAESSGKTRAVSDIGLHWMDTAEYVTGSRITEVMADFKILHQKRKKTSGTNLTFSNSSNQEEFELIDVDTEDYANILLHFSNGAVGNISVSQVMAGRKASLNLNVGGAVASAEWCTDTCNQLWIGARDSANQILEKDPGLLSDEASVYAGFPGGHGEGFADAVKNNFSAIYRSIMDPNVKKTYAVFRDGVHMLKVCDAIYESAHKRSWISVE